MSSPGRPSTTRHGAIKITHVKRRDSPTERYFKLPAACPLGLASLEPDVPEIPEQETTVSDTYAALSLS